VQEAELEEGVPPEVALAEAPEEVEEAVEEVDSE